MIRELFKKCIAVLIALLLSAQGQGALVWAAEAATLDGIEVQPDQVTMHLSKEVRYNSFITVEPPRLIVELLNTEFAAAQKTQQGQGTLLNRVRAAQYQREPNLITRIVLDLKKLAAYRAKWDGGKLIVILMGGDSDSDEGADAVADEEAPAVEQALKPAIEPAKKTVVERELRPVVKRVQKPVPVPEPAPVMRDAAAEDVAPVPAPALKPEVAAVAPEPEAAPKPAAMPKRMTTQASEELTRMAMSSDVRPGAPVEAAGQRRASKGRKPADAEARRDILATLSTDPITLDFDNTNIQDILKLLAVKAKVNVVYGPDVTGALTLHLSDVPFNEAFMTVLSMQGLVVAQVGQNILRIMTPITMSKERASAVTQTRVIHLNYVKAADVKKALDSVRTAEARAGVVNFDEYTNSLIITDSLDGIAAAERLLAELDVRPRQVMIECKLVEVILSKDFNVGIEWDYFSVDQSKQFGQQGWDVIGTVANPLVVGGAVARPFDNNAQLNAVGTAIPGAGGRGTGVFLPATNVFGAFTYGRITNNYFLNATLTAAASRGKAKVLSDPKISALNGEKASIDITTNIPYVTSETVQGATPTTTEKVSYTVTGIKLEVTPNINSDGSITLEIKPEVSQPSTVASAAGGTGAISTDSRSAQTTVHVNDGDTIVIGGLISDTESENIAKIPLLGDIPILGWLFKKKTNVRNRTELLIFVTSKIVNPS
ncbi:MAG: type IV pilus secretin PilQ [Elusimicrobiota bacterium]